MRFIDLSTLPFPAHHTQPQLFNGYVQKIFSLYSTNFEQVSGLVWGDLQSILLLACVIVWAACHPERWQVFCNSTVEQCFCRSCCWMLTHSRWWTLHSSSTPPPS